MARKYGIWKTRYVSKNVFEGWVQINNEPVLFESERGALEYMHDIEMKLSITLDTLTARIMKLSSDSQS